MARPTQYQKLSLQLDAENKRLKAKLAQTKKQMSGVGKVAKSIGPMIAATFGVSSIVGFGRQILTLTADFGSMMSRVQALTGATDELTETLGDLAQEMGKSTQFTAVEAAEAMTFLAQAGLEVGQIYNALPKTLELAAAGQVSLAEAADISTNIMSAYGLQAKDLAKVNDIIANVTSGANTNVIEFAEAFKMVGPIAKAAGQDIVDVSAGIGLLANAGIKGTMAGTQLRTMMAKLIKPSAEAAKVLKKFGIETQIGGQLRPLNEILKDMRASGMGVADMFTVFDLRAAGAGAVLKDASLTFDDFVTDVGKSGTAAAMASMQMDNLKGDTLKLTSAWDGLLLSMGQGADSPLRETTQGLTAMIPVIAQVGQAFFAIKDLFVLSIKAIALPLKNLTASFADLAQLDFKGAARNIKEVFTETGDAFVDFGKKTAGRWAEATKEGILEEGGVIPPPEEIVNVNDWTTVGSLAASSLADGFASDFALQMDQTIAGWDLSAALSDVFAAEVPEWLEDPAGIDAIVEGFAMADEKAEEFVDTIGMLREQITDSFMDVAGIIGRVANGIANAKDNWAAMGATVVSGAIQMVGKINEIREMTKTAAQANMAASQAEGVAGAVKAGAGIPFPGNLLAIATGVATVLSTIAPFIGSFAKGIDFVPQTGMALIHKGEAVIPANENRRGGNGQLVAVVQGSDLHFVLDEYSRKRNNSF
jgi:TP901 family phage tail tape measure protein